MTDADDRSASPWALYRTDYATYCERKLQSSRFPRLVAGLRLLANPELRALLLLRVANSSPRATWWLWRNLFIRRYSIDWLGPSEIGPGLSLPHPIGLVLGRTSRLGADVGLGPNVTLGGRGDGRRAVLGDRVTVYAGAVIVGVQVGDDCIIGANSVVMRDVPAGMIVTPGGVRRRAAADLTD